MAATNEDDEYDAKESYYSIAHRVREPITEQSKMLVGGQLKPYQLQGLEWLVSLYNNNLNGILADEMGLGKTIQVIALLLLRRAERRQPRPSLLVVPASLLGNWRRELETQFRFDPQRGPPRLELDHLRARMHRRESELLIELKSAPAELKRFGESLKREQQRARAAILPLARERDQAQANARA